MKEQVSGQQWGVRADKPRSPPMPSGREPRVSISLACTECKARNYKTTKSPGQLVELRKFCKQCKKHTLHRETK